MENNIFDIKQFITEWNLRYPFDRFWRQKYKVPFGSELHRNMNFIDMAMDLMEEKIISELNNEIPDNVEELNNEYLQEEIKKSKNQEYNLVKNMSQGEIDEDFKNLDISQF